MKPRVKICCIGSVEEARLTVAYGASALGLVGKMPSGPGVIDDTLIATIVRSIPPAIGSFLLTSETSAPSVIAHHQRVHTNTIQLVDALAEGTYRQIREALPSVKLVQVIHVMDERSVNEALEAAEQVDALLLDSGDPTLAVKVLGGTGKTHNWKWSRQIVERSAVPVFLAGGISSVNVREAIDTVQPFGVDLCSSVRTDGKLDEKKLDLFMRMALG